MTCHACCGKVDSDRRANVPILTIASWIAAFEASRVTVTNLGWLLVTAGICFGGGLGVWFWYRWVPVPAALHEPLSTGRWMLVGTHVVLVLAGFALISTALSRQEEDRYSSIGRLAEQIADALAWTVDLWERHSRGIPG